MKKEKKNKENHTRDGVEKEEIKKKIKKTTPTMVWKIKKNKHNG